jgi:hypothetical protein
MKKSIRLLMGLWVSAFMLAVVVASPAMAQDKAKAEKGKSTRTVLMENAKVIVSEVTYQPGDANTGIATTTTRVVRSLTGGTLETTSPDGKKETKVRKVGEVWISEPGPAYTNKNVGKTVVTLYIVQVK